MPATELAWRWTAAPSRSRYAGIRACICSYTTLSSSLRLIDTRVWGAALRSRRGIDASASRRKPEIGPDPRKIEALRLREPRLVAFHLLEKHVHAGAVARPTGSRGVVAGIAEILVELRLRLIPEEDPAGVHQAR